MKKRFFRFNQQIQSKELRVIGTNGKQVGILGLGEALKLAQEQDVDLVEIAPTAKPPVAKLIGFKRFLFEQEQKEKKSKKSRGVETKEIRVGPFISDHDLEVKINQGRKFLTRGNNFKLTVQFKPRQMRHTEFATKIVEKVKEILGNIARIEREPRWEGRRLTIIFAKGGSGAKIQN